MSGMMLYTVGFPINCPRVQLQLSEKYLSFPCIELFMIYIWPMCACISKIRRNTIIIITFQSSHVYILRKCTIYLFKYIFTIHLFRERYIFSGKSEVIIFNFYARMSLNSLATKQYAI